LTLSNSNLISGDEIDLKSFFKIVWKSKVFIFLIVSIFTAIGIYYLRHAEQKYAVNITYQQIESSNNAGGLGGLGALGALTTGMGGIGASISTLLPSSSSADFESFKYLITSEEIAEIIFQNKSLVQKLFHNEFDKNTNLFRKPETTSIGLLKNQVKTFITGRSYETYIAPNPKRLQLLLKEAFSVNVSEKTKFLTIAGFSSKPDVLIELINSAVIASDDLVKKRYIEKSTQSLNFYQNKISRSKSRELRQALANLIVTEEKKLMLSTTGKNFVVKPISRPQISYKPAKPNPILILVLSVLLGVLCGIIIIFIRKIPKD
jgi:LPS O-antigen subunit length determinant protein (WzzB/FepE family)